MQFRRLFSGLAVAAVVATAAYAKDMIDNPEYKYWSGCGANSFVTLKSVTDMGGNKSETETTHKVLENTPEKVTLETSMTMMMGGKPYAMPASKREIAAKVEKPEAAKAEGEKPKEGDEEVTVGGKSLKCHWTEVHNESNGMKTDTKMWMSDEIPGHIAKMESKMSGSMSGTMTMEATKWEKK